MASPITQVGQPSQSTSLADQLATNTPTSPASAQASSDSFNSGAASPKPARPPKAAQRPSTASGHQDRTENGGSEGTTLVGAPATSPQDGIAADKAVGSDAPGGIAPGQPALAAPVQADGLRVVEETTKPSSSASTALGTGESSSKEEAPSTSPPSSTAPLTAPSSAKPASPPSSPAPAASTATSPPPAATTSRAPVATAPKKAASLKKAPQPAQTKAKADKKQKKSLFLSLFGCIPCVSSPGHDETAPNSPEAGIQKRPSTAARLLEKEKENPKSATTSSSSNEKTNEKEVPLTPVEPESAITPPTQEPLAVAAQAEPVGPPPPTAAPSARGVVLPQEETEGVTSGAVVPPGQEAPSQVAAAAGVAPAAPTKTKRKRSGKHPQSGTDGIITSVPEPGARQGGLLLAADTTDEEGSTDEDEEEEEEEEDEEQSLIARGGVGIPVGEDGVPRPLLVELPEDLKGRKCLVLDLDETLVHSSFKMVHQADYVVPVEIENQFHNVYVIKRPGVDGFLKAMGEIYEVVVFTASLSKYADPVLDQLDVHRVVRHRLFRESCYNNKGNYVKDLSQLGRPIDESIIIDNSPASYVFHPNNAVPISSWFNDPHDTELTDLVPFLTDLSTVDDVRAVLDANLYQHLNPVPGGTAGGVAGTGFVQA